MATYKVVLKDDSHYVLNLPGFAECMLIYFYPGGDCDTRMTNHDMMHGALYDLYQVRDSLKDGDIFETEFGNFVCSGVHVFPV
jgi:hypothetical protein